MYKNFKAYAPETEIGSAALAAPAAPPASTSPLTQPPQAPAAGAPAPEQQTTPAQDSWFSKLSPEDKAWAESKGWKSETDPATIMQSYQNLEKLFGADKAGRTVVLPKDENDTAALEAIQTKLGKPATPQEYEIDLPEGADTAFADTAKNWFHKAGLTTKQAKAVAESYKALELDTIKKLDDQHAQEVEGLQKEWGASFDNKVEIAKAALKAAGIEEAQAKAIERAIGPAAATKVFEFFGRNYTEAGPPGSDTRTSPGFQNMTPASAMQKMDALQSDPNFMARYRSSDPKVRSAAIEEMDALAKLAVNNRL